VQYCANIADEVVVKRCTITCSHFLSFPSDSRSLPNIQILVLLYLTFFQLFYPHWRVFTFSLHYHSFFLSYSLARTALSSAVQEIIRQGRESRMKIPKKGKGGHELNEIGHTVDECMITMFCIRSRSIWCPAYHQLSPDHRRVMISPRKPFIRRASRCLTYGGTWWRCVHNTIQVLESTGQQAAWFRALL
jgi:hypothetical protein